MDRLDYSRSLLRKKKKKLNTREREGAQLVRSSKLTIPMLSSIGIVTCCSVQWYLGSETKRE